MTDIILLERVENLGQMGDEVRVKPGYARNFLLPQGKALRATKENRSYFDERRKQLEAENLRRRQEAEKIAEQVADKKVSMVRAASETGQLYGSVSTRDIAEALTAAGVTVDRRQIVLDQPIKALGLYQVPVRLHPELSVEVTINVARTDEEAEMQLERGAAITAKLLESEEEAAEAAEELYEAHEELEEALEETVEEPAEAEAGAEGEGGGEGESATGAA